MDAYYVTKSVNVLMRGEFVFVGERRIVDQDAAQILRAHFGSDIVSPVPYGKRNLELLVWDRDGNPATFWLL